MRTLSNFSRITQNRRLWIHRQISRGKETILVIARSLVTAHDGMKVPHDARIRFDMDTAGLVAQGLIESGATVPMHILIASIPRRQVWSGRSGESTIIGYVSPDQEVTRIPATDMHLVCTDGGEYQVYSDLMETWGRETYPILLRGIVRRKRHVIDLIEAGEWSPNSGLGMKYRVSADEVLADPDLFLSIAIDLALTYDVPMPTFRIMRDIGINSAPCTTKTNTSTSSTGS